MKSISVEELKKIELKILIEIDKICKEQNIQYSLCGGSLIGAIRHKGFIPWDDDIDIFMMRKDYERFIEYCINNSSKLSFFLLCSETNDKYGYLFGKAMMKGTHINEFIANPHNIDVGVYVDVFPVDYLADDLETAKKNYNKSRYYRELLVARNWKRFFKSKTHSWIYEPIRFMFYILSRFTTEKKLIYKIHKIDSKFSCSETKYFGCLCGSYREKDIYKAELFNNYIDVEFEGRNFKAISGYDEYLSNVYGDYMKLPPEEKRISHHMFEAFID